MAASAWQFYNSLREKLGVGEIDLSAANFKMALFTTTTGYNDKTLSSYGSLATGDEVLSANNYVRGGLAMGTEVWATGASAAQYKFDSDNVVWTASGGTIADVKGAIVYATGGELICYSTLTQTGNIDITDTNTLTVTIHANGIFTLT